MEERNYYGPDADGGCGKIVICTPADFRDDNPACPDCGTTMNSHGIAWQCHRCCRYLMKIKRPRKEEYPDRPPCPDCGSQKVVKNGGIRLMCKDCGRSYPFIKRG